MIENLAICKWSVVVVFEVLRSSPSAPILSQVCISVQSFIFGFFINQFHGFITSEYPSMVDLVLLHLPSFMDTTRYYLLSAWWCGNPDCWSRIRGHCERIFGSFSWLWSWDGRSFSSSSFWLLSPLLHGVCYLSQSPQLPEKMN